MIDRAKIIELWNAGATVQEVAGQTGLKPSSIRTILTRLKQNGHDIKPRISHGKKQPVPVYASRHKRNGMIIQRMMADGMSLETAAKYLGIKLEMARNCVLFAEINSAFTITSKKGQWFVELGGGGVYVAKTDYTDQPTLRDDIANHLMWCNGDMRERAIQFFRHMEMGGKIRRDSND